MKYLLVGNVATIFSFTENYEFYLLLWDIFIFWEGPVCIFCNKNNGILKRLKLYDMTMYNTRFPFRFFLAILFLMKMRIFIQFNVYF